MASAVQFIAEAVAKAKFVGTSDSVSDECVLFQILQVFKINILILFVFFIDFTFINVISWWAFFN